MTTYTSSTSRAADARPRKNAKPSLSVSPDEEEFLTKDGVAMQRLLADVLHQLPASSYEFMPMEKYESLLNSDVGSGMRVYWREMLYRSHWAAQISLVRCRSWLRGTLQARSDQNLMAFAASARGMIESAVDTWDGLGNVAVNLAQMAPIIDEALDGRASKQMVSADLEDWLIHFNYARKLPKMTLHQLHIGQSKSLNIWRL